MSCIAVQHKQEPVQRCMRVPPTILLYTIRAMAMELPEYMSPPDILWQLS